MYSQLAYVLSLELVNMSVTVMMIRMGCVQTHSSIVGCVSHSQSSVLSKHWNVLKMNIQKVLSVHEIGAGLIVPLVPSAVPYCTFLLKIL